MTRNSLSSKRNSFSATAASVLSGSASVCSSSSSSSRKPGPEATRKKVQFAKSSSFLATYHEIERIPMEYKSDYFYTSEELKDYYEKEIDSIARRIRKASKMKEKEGQAEAHLLLVESDTFTWRGLECWKPGATEDPKQRKKRREKHSFAVVTKWRGLRVRRHINSRQNRTEELSLFSKESSKQDRSHAIAIGTADAKEAKAAHRHSHPTHTNKQQQQQQQQRRSTSKDLFKLPHRLSVFKKKH